MSSTPEARDYCEAFANAIFLTGATASGKSALGIDLAIRLNAEIVSMDSMAIYRKMDVGTAKPTLEERRRVPHRMIDVVDPTEEYSLMDYLRDSAEVVDDIESRGKVALFVGGTPLYLKAILFGVFSGPGADKALRDELLEKVERDGPEALWNELRVVDPETAQRLHPNDVKRVVRALEVFKLTGVPISRRQREFQSPPRVDARRAFILTRERETLYERVNQRVDEMIKNGFVDEVKRLVDARELGATASQAVGYRELAAFLRGEVELADAVETIKQYTRNFAKRQETWFRSLEKFGAQRVAADGRTRDEILDEIVANVAALR